MDDSAQFCPACGRSVHAPPPSKTAAAVQALAVHVRILGILWAIYGVFEIAMAFWTVGMSSVYFPVFQKMVAPEANSPLSPETLHAIFVWSGIFALVTGALGLFAGWMLLRRERSGRTVSLFAAFISLIQLPIGTGLAIYTFVELLSASAREKYAQLLAPQR
jgi:hypothetical protein